MLNIMKRIKIEEKDPISSLCDVINKFPGCRTISSSSQYYFPDEETESNADGSSGKHTYVTIVFSNTKSMATIIDTFQDSPYKWKIIFPKRSTQVHPLENNELRIIFQTSFDNRAGRDREFTRVIKCFKRAL